MNKLASIIICHAGLLISKPIMNTSLLSHFSSLAVRSSSGRLFHKRAPLWLPLGSQSDGFNNNLPFIIIISL